MKHTATYIALVIVFFFGLACSFGDDTAKANDLIKEANKFVSQANTEAEKSLPKGNEFDRRVGNIKNDEQLREVREFGNEISKHYSLMEENYRKAGENFTEASKLNVNEKFKEYLGAKGQEMKKRAEHAAEMQKIPKALNDAPSEKAYREAIAPIVQNARSIAKEGQTFADKSEAIVKANPDVIKPLT